MSVDYRALLGRYMEEVVMNEGVHFADQPCMILTREESAELERIWAERIARGADPGIMSVDDSPASP